MNVTLNDLWDHTLLNENFGLNNLAFIEIFRKKILRKNKAKIRAQSAKVPKFFLVRYERTHILNNRENCCISTI